LQASKKALEKAQEVDYSLKSSDLLGKYDLNSSSLKMLEICSRTPKGKPSKKFSKKLPKQGLMLSGVLYQQKMWEPATRENACGLLPTPLASTKIEQKVPFKQGGTPLLAALLPTPRASGAMTEKLETIKERGKDNCRLEERIALPLPTPTARDYKDSGPNTNYEKAAKKKRLAGVLNHTHSTLTGEGTYLSPLFVEEMMGFPIGWTDLSA
tara:strand:- start:59 stop:691 length:633 start_codon:yes stop_codon:yes gene_type:complete